MAIELVTYADLKKLLGLTKAAISDYPALEVINNSVLYAVEEYLGRRLEKDDRTETIFIGNTPSQMISLLGLPISSIASVSITQAQTVAAYTSVDYDITDYGIRMLSKFSNAKIIVTYNGGYEDADVPTKINRAALLQISYEWQSKDQIGAMSTSTEGGYVQRPELGLLKEVKRMLNGKKHPLRIL